MFLLLAIWGCSGEKTLWSGTCSGQPCRLMLVKEPGAATAYTFSQLQIGELPPVPLNVQTTDQNGMPYSDSLFTGTETRFAGNRPAYLNNPAEHAPAASMLYLDPSKYNAQAYDTYSRFFLGQWADVRQRIKDAPISLPPIGGTVHGTRAEFTRLFHGTFEGADHFFMVTPDGVITLLEGKSPEKASGIPKRTSLASKVEMPGAVIRIADSVGFSPARLRSFRDDHDKSLENYFRLVYTP
ncbi:hypothetical protein C7T94_06430 [Pedobacter yulinensis]|uniref:Uncharacterized protein n=2 Tax=Pedobacter yulinensis TaxID=2126353 RepID=A0A2T3HPH2_9SPHI|nr:hypothetical protein C7T94_06430 [Pedobacter yulinensis]